jgi:hypothetical protein
MIRFKIVNGDDVLLSPWQHEPVNHGTNPQTAVVEMTKLRQQHPDAAISVERTTVIPKPEFNQVRFKIALPNNETRYSKVVSEDNAEALQTELQQQFPKGVVSRG